MNVIDIISENFLCVRRLPFEVVSYWTYKEGDELRQSESKREVVIQDYDLEYFQKTKPSKWDTDTPEKRFEFWKKNFPNGKKILKETRTVKNGGWWYVKKVENTDSTVRFSREYDKFFAPTLEEAIQLYLDSKNFN